MDDPESNTKNYKDINSILGEADRPSLILDICVFIILVLDEGEFNNCFIITHEYSHKNKLMVFHVTEILFFV